MPKLRWRAVRRRSRSRAMPRSWFLDVMVTKTAIKGKNGFVCLVERSWTSPIDDPGFWNPKGRAPVCFNPAAARSRLPRTIKKTDLILAGRTKAQMIETIAAAVDKGELPAMETGAM